MSGGMRRTPRQVREYCKRTGAKAPPLDVKPSIHREEGEEGIFAIPLINQGEEAFKHFFKLLAQGMQKPVEQYNFRPNRNWRVDFAYPQERIAIEINGQVHAIAAKRAADYEKWSALAEDGWIVLHYSPEQIEGSPDKCIRQVVECLQKRRQEKQE